MKAQVSVEFIIIISIALIVFLFLFSVVSKRNDELYSTRTSLYAKSVSDSLALNINSVFLAGNGFTKTILLPDTLKDNTDYDINIYPTEHLIKITWNQRQYSSPILTSSLSGALTSLQGEYDIENTDGTITITSLGAPVCGNGATEGTEACDDGNTITEDCGDGTVQSGTYCNFDCSLEFTLSETCELGDSQACTDGDGYPGTQDCLGDCSAFGTCISTEFCGDNTINGPEVCDGTDLGTDTCQTQGFDDGTLDCLGDCTAFDTSGCYMYTTCQQACTNLGLGQGSCRASCGGAFKNPAPLGNPYCSPDICCCKN